MIRGIKNYFSFFGMLVATINQALMCYYARYLSYKLLSAILLAKLSLVCELSPQQQKSKIHRTLYA